MQLSSAGAYRQIAVETPEADRDDALPSSLIGVGLIDGIGALVPLGEVGVHILPLQQPLHLSGFCQFWTRLVRM